MSVNIDGLVAVVTGSGGGIGQGIALKLAERGGVVVVNDIDKDKIRTTLNAIEKAGGKANGFTADVSNSAQVKALFAACFEEHGRVDILINNAGIADDALLEDMSEAQWDRVIDVNLKGAFLCSQTALTYMRKNKFGRIINISAEDIFFGEVGMVNYHCSKYGMLGLTISVANEMARWVKEEGADMTCNCITPGYLETDLRTASPMSELRLDTKNHIPLGRECDPVEDAGNTVLFLSSREAGYITSNIINAGGGLYSCLIS